MSHIRKTGSSCAMRRISALARVAPEWLKQNNTNRIRACDEATKATTRFQGGYSRVHKGNRCALCGCRKTTHCSSKPRLHHCALPAYAYSILSQYFHCKESRDHRNRARLMPATIDEWLEPFVNRVQKSYDKSSVPNFGCYNPINLQREFVGFSRIQPKTI